MLRPCHQDSNGAGCVKECDDSIDLYKYSCKALSSSIVDVKKGELLVDSGCNLTLLPDDEVFKRFVVSKEQRAVRLQLGSTDSEIVASGKCVVHLPLKSVDGSVRIAKEVCVFSKLCRCPLFGAMYRDLKLCQRGESSVEVDGVKGGFNAIVHRKHDKTPVLKVLLGLDASERKQYGCAAVEGVSVVDRIGALVKDHAVAKTWSEDVRKDVLLVLHRRFAHATCRRLFLTLSEHGLGGVFSDQECRAVGCDVCNVVNARRVKIPKVADAVKSEFAVGEVAYQDLMQLPKAWDASKWTSVIIDARSRQIDLLSIKAKDQALSHAVGYIRRTESVGRRVKRWRSDNGGEFWNEDYDALLRKEGIAQERGAPYTPQTQGLVERVNGTIKRLLGKLLRTLKLPVSVWPALLPGVVQQVNNVVHSTLQESPCKQSGSDRAGRLPEIVVGDVVLVVDIKSKEPLEGYYGGFVSPQEASVILRTSKGKWRVRRVHPSTVKFRAFQGEREPIAGGNPLLARDLATDVEAAIDSGDYDEFDGDAYDDAGVPEGKLDDFDEPDVDEEDDDGVYVRLFDDDDNDDDVFAGVCNNKAKNQLPATKDEVRGGSHREADLKELRSFFTNGALGPRITVVTPEIAKMTLTAGWRRTWKGEGDDRTAKSRLYVRGFQDRRDRGWIETYAGTADPGLERINHIYALYRRWKAAKVDIATAFLQAKSEANLNMRMPYDLPPEAIEFGYVPGGVYKMLKAVYGRIDSPNIFATQLTARLIDEKWQNVAEAIYVKSTEAKGLHQGVLRTHMDDLFCNGEDAVALLSDIKKHFQTGPITEFKEGEFGVYNGIRIRWDAKSGVAEHDQKDYADGIDTKLTKAESRRRFGVKDLELSKDDEINVDYKPEQQSWTGILGWMARTQPHLSVIFSMISRNNTRPSAQSVLSVKRACQYAKDNHVSLKFHGVENPVLILWLDGSFNLTECDGRKGWEAQVVDESEVDEKD